MLCSPLWDSHTTRRACSSNHSTTLGGFWPDWRRRAVAAYVRQWNCDRSSLQRSVKKMWSACIGFLIVIRERFVYCPFHISNLGGKPGCSVWLAVWSKFDSNEIYWGGFVRSSSGVAEFTYTPERLNLPHTKSDSLLGKRHLPCLSASGFKAIAKAWQYRQDTNSMWR